MKEKNIYSLSTVALIIGIILIVIAFVSAKGSNYSKPDSVKSSVTVLTTAFQKAEKKTEIKKNNATDKDESETAQTTQTVDEKPIIAHLAVGTVGSLIDYTGASVYASPRTSSEEIGKLNYNCAVKITDKKQKKKWFEVEMSNKGNVGYVQKKDVEEVFLKIGSENASAVRNRIVKEAYAHLGQNYKPKGKNLKGTTCNMFVHLLYKKQGITVPKKPNGQKAFGVPIDEKDAQPGDLVYYFANGKYGHVGLYLTDGYIINSAGHDGQKYPDGGVRISKLKYHDREQYVIEDMLGDSQTAQSTAKEEKTEH